MNNEIVNSTADIEAQIRAQALNPSESFIVQAPAGSGKTELLVQRFLRLLSIVNQPEEIVSVTFTRKAAGEMKERILKALNSTHHQEPNSAHQLLTWKLAKAALQQSTQKGWALEHNSQRLRILTIDALAAELVNKMPLLARLSPLSTLTEEPGSYYQESVQNFLCDPHLSEKLKSSIEHLLLLLNNRFSLLENLLINLLARREQWLGYLIHHHHDPTPLRTILEKGLWQIAKETLSKISLLWDKPIQQELFELLQYAGKHEEAYQIFAQSDRLPSTDPLYLAQWKLLATLFLTQDKQRRKTVNKKLGFPSADEGQTKEEKLFYKTQKIRMQKLLDQLPETLLLCFAEILDCPPCHYSDHQWKTVSALVILLPQLAAQLNLLFQQKGVIDFVELNLSAQRALSDKNRPTDLALQLDYQIQHLLVDEFQDTSLMQFHLIEQLIRGWQPEDGHSLFLVGDPMQSIYRFRRAEVGLFLRIQKKGIGNLKPVSLQLQFNFRSDHRMIDWINKAFPHFFPTMNDIALGAIPYTPSQATHTFEASNPLNFYPISENEPFAEANQVLQCVQHLQYQHPSDTIAILVQSRQQLLDIIPLLKKSNILYQAVDIETLQHCSEIQDLFSLTRALYHVGDKIAWLAILRAPWCGLLLSDLFQLSQAAGPYPLWTVLQNGKGLEFLSEDGKKRSARLIPILQAAFNAYGQKPLHQWIKSAWLNLGGPAHLQYEFQLENVQTFFNLLQEEAENTEFFSINRIKNKMDQLFSPASHSTATLKIMTIHKAKGLEFDHVILPTLSRLLPSDPQQLLAWFERPRQETGNDLILAPLTSNIEEKDTIYQYLKKIEKAKSEFEQVRLLYVALTRAKKSLHFISLVNEEKISSNRRSFLSYLYPYLTEMNVKKNSKDKTKFPLENPELFKKKMMRWKSDWKPAPLSKKTSFSSKESFFQKEIKVE